MAENTTAPVSVTADVRPHPALRRLARGCISLVRWQRAQPDDKEAKPTTGAAGEGVASGDVEAEVGHD